MVYRLLWAPLCLSLVSACSSTETTSQIAPDTIFAEAVALSAEVSDVVEDIRFEEGLTTIFDVPNDRVSYVGLIEGSTSEVGLTTPIDIAYVARLDLDVDFDLGGVSGTVGSFVTNLDGFEQPSGDITLSGQLGTNYFGDVTLDVTGDDLLIGDTRAAQTSFGALGDFVGSNADAASGDQSTIFEWVAGPGTGLVTLTEGEFNALR